MRDAAREQERPGARATLARGARQQIQDRLERPTRRRCRSSSAPRAQELRSGRDRRATSTGVRSSRPGSLPAPYPAILTTRSSAKRRAGVRRRPGDAEAHHRGPLAHRQRRVRPASRQQRNGATTSRSTPTRRAQRVLMTWHNLRQQNVKPDRQVRTSASADFVAPKDSGVTDYIGVFAVTAGLGIDKQSKAFEDAARRLQRDHAEGARRPAGRSVRRAPARARAQRALGLCAGRDARQRRR